MSIADGFIVSRVTNWFHHNQNQEYLMMNQPEADFWREIDELGAEQDAKFKLYEL